MYRVQRRVVVAVSIENSFLTVLGIWVIPAESGIATRIASLPLSYLLKLPVALFERPCLWCLYGIR
jgi:hypothetical protein